MVWRFYSGITKLNNKEILNCVPLPYKLVKSHLTESRIQHLMDCVYEAHNSELCQIVGDHLDGNIPYHNETQVIGHFLTQYTGKVLKIHNDRAFDEWLRDDQFQLLINSLQRRQSQSQHFNDNFILYITSNWIAHQSFFSLVQLLSTHPIAELNICGINFQSTSDVDCPSGYRNSSAHLSDIQLLSQLFTSSNTLSVLDISYTDIGPKAAACFADLRNVLICDLRMAMCQLGPAGADKIGEMLYHNNSIVSIDLRWNNIEDSGVERLVYHLNKKNKLQHLNLEDNKITAVGANHLRRLIATDRPTLTSIELSQNPLKDKGVHVILSSLTVTMEHTGLIWVDMTPSYPIIINSLNKTKSISCDLHGDCEVISLANIAVLKRLEARIDTDSANYKMLSAIRQSDNIETLKLHYVWYMKEWVADITKLLEYSKTLTQLTIITEWVMSQDDILSIADSLKVNTSVKQFAYAELCMDQTKTLKFLDKLKETCVVKEVTLGVTHWAYNDYQFLEDVEKCVQQINHVRSSTSLLEVKIAYENSV